jgi:hypothetical protein
MDSELNINCIYIWGGWSGVGVGEAGLNRNSKNSLERVWIARLKSECRETERSIQPVRCVRAAASGVSAPDTDSAGRCGRVLPAAGLADFFARTVRWERQGLYEENECRVMKRNER